MSTVEPHTPEPGWFWRWTVQSAQLMPRMGAAACLILSGMFVAGMVGLSTEAILHSALGDTRLVQDFARLAALLFALPVLLAVTALMVQADRGQRPDWAHLRGLIPQGLLLATFVAVVIQIFINTMFGIWGNPSKPMLDTLGAVLVDEPHWALGATIIGANSLAYAVVVQTFAGLLAAPFVVGLSASWKDAAAFDRRMSKLMRRVHATIRWVLIVGSIMATLTTGLGVGVALIFFLLIWMMVAAREIAGGIRSNGKVSIPVSAPVAQPQTQG